MSRIFRNPRILYKVSKSGYRLPMSRIFRSSRNSNLSNNPTNTKTMVNLVSGALQKFKKPMVHNTLNRPEVHVLRDNTIEELDNLYCSLKGEEPSNLVPRNFEFSGEDLSDLSSERSSERSSEYYYDTDDDSDRLSVASSYFSQTTQSEYSDDGLYINDQSYKNCLKFINKGLETELAAIYDDVQVVLNGKK